MRLTDVESQVWVLVVGIEETTWLEQRLAQHGLFIGDKARVVRLAPFGGPLLIEAGGRELALGRRLAEKIVVELA